MDLIDAPLSELGVSQCEAVNSSEIVPNLTHVIVSPLNRALMTAYLLFKKHPNFGNIRFIVDPDVKEHLHTACDVPRPIDETLEEFNKLFPQGLDLSLMEPIFEKTEGHRNLWYLEIVDEETRNRFRERLVTSKNHARD